VDALLRESWDLEIRLVRSGKDRTKARRERNTRIFKLDLFGLTNTN